MASLLLCSGPGFTQNPNCEAVDCPTPNSSCASAPALAAGVTRETIVQAGIDFLLGEVTCGGTRWTFSGDCETEGADLRRDTAVTALCGEVLARGGDSSDPDVVDKMSVALDFVLENVESTCAEREWAFFSLRFLLALEELDLVPTGQEMEVSDTIETLINALQECLLAQSQRGGIPEYPWGFNTPFKTAPSLLALYEASLADYSVFEVAWRSGVDSLNRNRVPNPDPCPITAVDVSQGDGTPDPGAYHYQECRALTEQCVACSVSWKERATYPGSISRMVPSETALFVWGAAPGSEDRIRGALDLFFNGQYLDQSQQPQCIYDHLAWVEANAGSHSPPFGVAPYYFYLAHVGVAQALHYINCPTERDALRQRQLELIYDAREEDGQGNLWWDHSPSSPHYPTAMALLALLEHSRVSPASAPPDPSPEPDNTQFSRADSNSDDIVDISDGINTLNVLFIGIGQICCQDAADANDDGDLNISDAIATFDYLFSGGDPPPAPLDCLPGPDPTADTLDCEPCPNP